MKCREILAIEHPICVNPDCGGGCEGCPEDYGYLEEPVYCHDESIDSEVRCTQCWDREIPEGIVTPKPIDCEQPLKKIEMNETDTEDKINHPNHYTNGGMECIDEMLLVFGRGVVANFCLCNAWKYRYRALHKNGQEDIDKSHWYMAKYKELVDEVVDYGTIEF